MSDIIKIVTEDDVQRQIIPIWGMGGLGKTALVNGIYERVLKINEKFKMYAWIILSDPFNVLEVVRRLIAELENKEDFTRSETLKRMEKRDLNIELNRLLHKGPYLIVIDNVSSTREWNALIQHFQDEQSTSRIIVTTRDKRVAEHCSRKNMYEIEALKDDAALKLLEKTVFMETASFDGQQKILKKQAKRIIQKCSGLPLAISTIGGFLTTKSKTSHEWEIFIENFTSELETNSSLKILKTSLTPNYKEFVASKQNCEESQYRLNLCFLYVSIFFEDENMIRRRRLIRRWIAEGYAEKDEEYYLTDFINRSIIQASDLVAVGSVASITYFHAHNLLREITVALSAEQHFCFFLGSRSSNPRTHGRVRHLSISSSWDRNADELKAIDISHVRSLTVRGEWVPAALELEKMPMLRVLDLEGTGELLRDHHIERCVHKLLHLRYLSLRGCHNISQLTHSLGNLWDLQTLDIRGTSIMVLPKTIIKLGQLQYLRAGQIAIDKEPEANTALTLCGVTEDMCCCDSNFRVHVRDKHGVELPEGSGKLMSLETLGVIDVGANKGTLDELEKLGKLRKLGVTGLRREYSEQFLSATSKLALQSLSIRSEGGPGLQDCLDSKSSCHPTNKVQSLKLYGNLVTLPSWIKLLENLVKLKLQSTKLGQDAILVLGSLPCLAILRLLSNSIVGKDLHLHFQRGTFLCLVLLKLDGLTGLESLVFEQGATPNLELLQVENCNDIKNKIQGTEYLPRLKRDPRNANDPATSTSSGGGGEMVQECSSSLNLNTTAFKSGEAGPSSFPSPDSEGQLPSQDQPPSYLDAMKGKRVLTSPAGGSTAPDMSSPASVAQGDFMASARQSYHTQQERHGLPRTVITPNPRPKKVGRPSTTYGSATTLPNTLTPTTTEASTGRFFSGPNQKEVSQNHVKTQPSDSPNSGMSPDYSDCDEDRHPCERCWGLVANPILMMRESNL